MKRIFFTIWLFASNLIPLLAQEPLHGRVRANDGQYIEGASIKDANGNILAISDSLGNFILQQPLPESVFASHIAYRSEIYKIGAGTAGPIAIVMSPVSAMMDVVEVSTGIQRIPKERATGAFSHIDNATFNEQVGPDVLSRLEAVANGLSIERVASTGSEMGIRIRGLSTLSTGAIRDPLIILDNFPYEGDLDNINPNDVEHITLLKDAAAASIWGARAGNGVIVITTKRAVHNQPLRINFNSNLTIGSKPNLAYYPLMTGADFIEMERALFSHGHRFSDTASRDKPPFSPAYEVLFREQRGEINQAQANIALAELGRIDTREQYLRHMYKDAVAQQYAISLQGGSDNSTWYLSTGYDKNKSTLDAVDDRFNLTFKNTYVPFRAVRLQAGLTHTQSRSDNGRTGFSPNTIPYTQIVDNNGNALAVMRDFRQPFLDTLGDNLLLDWNYYPLTDDKYVSNRFSSSHTLLNLGIDFRPLNWLGLNVKYQYGRQQARNDLLNGENSYSTRNLINQYSRPLPNTGELEYMVPKGAVLDQARSYLQSHNIRGQININRTWQAHEISALVGLEGSHRNTNTNSNRTYGYNPEILTFNAVDYLSRYPHYITGRSSFIAQGQSFSDQTRRFISVFANGGYTYASKYTLSLSARKDASNQFGVKFNDRWNLLWSTGLSWEASKERFYPFDGLPYLRFRATYGFSGNTDLGRSAVTTMVYSGNNQYFATPTAYISQDANPELGWEKVRMINVAMDFSFKGQRVNGSIDFFAKHGTDLFGTDPIDPTTGLLASVVRNIASLRGRGVDVELNTENLTRRVKWNTTLNFSYYADKVESYYLTNFSPSSHVAESGAMTRVEGQHLYSIYSFRWAGLDPETGDPVGYLAGEKSKDYRAITGLDAEMQDLVSHGSAVPVVFGSMGNSIRYKNIGLTFRILFKAGFYFRNEGIMYNQLFAGRGMGQHTEYRHRWKEPGDERHTNVPSMIYPTTATRDNFYRLSEIKVERGDHVRLQYVNIHYDIGKKQHPSIPVNSIRIYFNAANLGLIWKSTDTQVDPAFGAGAMPPAPTYSIGLKLAI